MNTNSRDTTVAYNNDKTEIRKGDSKIILTDNDMLDLFEWFFQCKLSYPDSACQCDVCKELIKGGVIQDAIVNREKGFVIFV